MSLPPRTLAVTGASGMLGRHLCDHFRRRGWRVRALVRDPSLYPFASSGIERIRAVLPDRLDDASLHGVDAVIHCAYTTRFSNLAAARRVNEHGTLRVLESARAAGVRRFVFVSSLSARADAASYYGRSKFALESRMDPARDLVVRPGLVLARDGGLAQRILRLIRRTRVAPLFDGGHQILQTVHIADLCEGFDRALQLDATGSLGLAEPDGLPMRDFLRLLARSAGCRALMLPVPVAPVLGALRASELVGLPLSVSSENLLGLISMRHVATRSDLERLGIRVRPARESVPDLVTATTRG